MSDREVTVQDVIGAVAGRFDPSLIVDVSGARRQLVMKIVQQLALLSFHSGIEAAELPSILRCRYTDQALSVVPIQVLQESTNFLDLVAAAVVSATEASASANDVRASARAAITLVVETHRLNRRLHHDAQEDTNDLLDETRALLFDPDGTRSPLSLLAEGELVKAYEVVRARLESAARYAATH